MGGCCDKDVPYIKNEVDLTQRERLSPQNPSTNLSINPISFEEKLPKLEISQISNRMSNRIIVKSIKRCTNINNHSSNRLVCIVWDKWKGRWFQENTVAIILSHNLRFASELIWKLINVYFFKEINKNKVSHLKNLKILMIF